MMETTKKEPTFWVSVIPIILLALLLAIVIVLKGADALDGGSQFALILATAVATALSMLLYGVKWVDLEKNIAKNIYSSSGSILIFLFIGAIAGTWMISGVVPTLICYGLQILHPAIFLVSACLICAVVSVVTGSSWTTCATIGVALMGIGYSNGFPEWWTAGAVISGAYFGDKMSALSDTTVLAASTAKVPLFDHIRYMMYTTVPSMTIALVIYIIAGFYLYDSSVAMSSELVVALEQNFNITPWLLVIPLFTFTLIIFKVPALLTLFLSMLSASVAMLIFQPDIVAQIGGGDELNFRTAILGVMTSCCNSTSIDTGNEVLNGLVATRGMGGAMNVIWLVLTAMCFGGVMVGSGMMGAITKTLLKGVKSVTHAVAATVFSGIFLNCSTGDQFMSIILSCDLNKGSFDRLGIDRRVLSRATEDSATVVSVLIPWNTCGVVQSMVLGVPTLLFMPFCFFNLLSPLMSIIVAKLNYKILRTNGNASASLSEVEDKELLL
ncbi:MAG: sodium:proton antiporter [Bacteroidaceae bacterium]|nr:sodium:proton antiporter [Bacteroidaceae bacterium]